MNEQATPRFEPAAIWRRFLAVVIDGCVLAIVQLPLSFLVGMMAFKGASEGSTGSMLGVQLFTNLFSLIIAFLYYGWFYKNKGATPGKMALGLRIMKASNGQNLSYWRAFGRETIGKMISAIILFIGYLMAIFRGDKKALHDIMFDTHVLKKN